MKRHSRLASFLTAMLLTSCATASLRETSIYQREAIEAALDGTAKIDAFTNSSDAPALTLAVRYCDLTVVKKLLAKGANPNALDSNGHSVVFGLTSRIANWDNGVISGYGARAGDDCDVNDPAIVKLLVEKGAKLNDAKGGEVLQFLASGGADEAIAPTVALGFDPNVPDAVGRTPLFHAADVQTARALLRVGANPLWRDAAGVSALRWFAEQAAQQKKMKSIYEALLAAGVRDEGVLDIGDLEPGARQFLKAALAAKDTKRADAQGNTALHLAVLSGAPPLVGEVLALHPDANALNADGEPPLMLLARNRANREEARKSRDGAGADPDRDIIRALVAAGANLKLQSPKIGGLPHAAVANHAYYLVLSMGNEGGFDFGADNAAGIPPIYLAQDLELAKLVANRDATWWHRTSGSGLTYRTHLAASANPAKSALQAWLEASDPLNHKVTGVVGPAAKKLPAGKYVYAKKTKLVVVTMQPGGPSTYEVGYQVITLKAPMTEDEAISQLVDRALSRPRIGRLQVGGAMSACASDCADIAQKLCHGHDAAGDKCTVQAF